MSIDLAELQEQMDEARAALIEQAEAHGLPYLAEACADALDRDDIIAAALVDLLAMGLTPQQAATSVRAGEIVALLVVSLQQVASLAWVPDEDGEA